MAAAVSTIGAPTVNFGTPAVNVDQLAAIAGLLSGTQAQQIEAAGTEAGETAIAAGAGAEAGAYGTATEIANENAAIARMAGGLASYQQTRELMKSIGETTAGAGSAGATGAGSVGSVLRSSYAQGALANQFINVQSSLEAGGYQEAAQASTAEQTASTAQQSAATAAAAAASTEAAQAAQQTKQLEALYPTQTEQITNLTNNPTPTPSPFASPGGGGVFGPFGR